MLGGSTAMLRTSRGSARATDTNRQHAVSDSASCRRQGMSSVMYGMRRRPPVALVSISMWNSRTGGGLPY